MTPENVVTNKEFAAFVSYMAKESAKEDCDWENVTLPDFLEALAAATDAAETPCYEIIGVDVKTLSKWRILADALWTATIYE
jgi:hypothetical protein